MSRQRLYSSDQARDMARRRLPRIVFDYIDGAAGKESAATGNLAALDRLRLLPRVLAPADQHPLAKRFLGQALGLPFGIAPMGMCNLAWPGADQLLAAEAVRRGMPHGISTAASSTLEAMAKQAGALAWFQLYVTGTLDAAWGLVDRAKAAGYRVLILTVDVPRVAPRPRDQRNGFTMPFRIGPRQFMDFALHPHWSLASLMHGMPGPANFDDGPGAKGFDRHASRAGANWAFWTSCGAAGMANSSSRGCCHPMTRNAFKPPAPMRFTSPTTAGASSTAHRLPSPRWPRSALPWGPTTRWSLTAACDRAKTS